MNIEAELTGFSRRHLTARMDLVARVVEHWFDVPETLERRVIAHELPRALRLFYERVGGSLEAICRQNFIAPPKDLQIVDGAYVFAWENQDVYSWGASRDSDDPSVLGRSRDARDGALAFACPDSRDHSSLWIGGKAASDVDFLKSIVNPAWEHVSI